MVIRKQNPLTGEWNEMDLPITGDQLRRFEHTLEPIQNIFPNLSLDQREFLKTGITPQSWDREFNQEGDE